MKGFCFFFLVLIGVAKSLTISSSEYIVLQNSQARISLNGTNFAGNLQAELYFGSEDGEKIELNLVVVDEYSAYTVEFTAPSFDVVSNYSSNGKAPIFIEVFDEQETKIFSDFSLPVAYLISSISVTENDGCTVGESLYIRQNIKLGQKYVGQIANPNQWAFYQWDIDTEPLYTGNKYIIEVSFSDSKHPLGVFVKFSNIYNTLPEFIQPDGTSECPGFECELMTKGVPVFPHDGCQFDARVLPCKNVRFKDSVPAGAQCLKEDVNIYSVTSKQTRSGRYVIGVQGQGLIPLEGSKKKNLGYCSECTGYETPEAITFSIEIKNSSSQVMISLFLLVLSLVSWLV